MMCPGSPLQCERRNTGAVSNLMLSRVLTTTRHKNWIGGLLNAAALAAVVGVAGVASAQTTLPLQAVGWQNEALPGQPARQADRSVCTTTWLRSRTPVSET